MATVRDVAREAGVSVASVSRALNGHSNVAPATRDRVFAAMRKLNFVPHAGARNLTRQRSDAIGVVLPDLFGEFFSEIVRGIDQVAHRCGKQLLLANMHGSAHETAAAIRAMRGRVDGLLVMPPQVDEAFFKENLAHGLPTVVINHDASALDLPSVAIDNYAGAYRMTQHLIERGCRRIVHIAGPRHNGDARERQRGFADAMADILGERSPVIATGDFTEDGGRQAAHTLIAGKMPFDAIFAANDVSAIGCLASLTDAGIAVPGQVAVAGFDDIPFARFLAPSLTTMEVHIVELGATAMEMLLQVMHGSSAGGQRHRILTPELVIRQSSGGVRFIQQIDPPGPETKPAVARKGTSHGPC
jgi:LacI family transcriptional regulator